MEFNTSETLNDTPNYVNLSNILNSREKYPFPSYFNGIENKSKLVMALRICAMKAGFG